MLCLVIMNEMVHDFIRREKSKLRLWYKVCRMPVERYVKKGGCKKREIIPLILLPVARRLLRLLHDYKSHIAL